MGENCNNLGTSSPTCMIDADCLLGPQPGLRNLPVTSPNGLGFLPAELPQNSQASYMVAQEPCNAVSASFYSYN